MSLKLHILVIDDQPEEINLFTTTLENAVKLASIKQIKLEVDLTKGDFNNCIAKINSAVNTFDLIYLDLLDQTGNSKGGVDVLKFLIDNDKLRPLYQKRVVWFSLDSRWTSSFADIATNVDNFQELLAVKNSFWKNNVKEEKELLKNIALNIFSRKPILWNELIKSRLYSTPKCTASLSYKVNESYRQIALEKVNRFYEKKANEYWFEAYNGSSLIDQNCSRLNSFSESVLSHTKDWIIEVKLKKNGNTNCTYSEILAGIQYGLNNISKDKPEFFLLIGKRSFNVLRDLSFYNEGCFLKFKFQGTLKISAEDKGRLFNFKSQKESEEVAEKLSELIKKMKDTFKEKYPS